MTVNVNNSSSTYADLAPRQRLCIFGSERETVRQRSIEGGEGVRFIDQG